MQTSNVFPSQRLTGNRKRSQEPALKSPAKTFNATKTLQKIERDTSIQSPKRRRQLTAGAAPGASNPFDKLQQLTSKALNGRGF